MVQALVLESGLLCEPEFSIIILSHMIIHLQFSIINSVSTNKPCYNQLLRKHLSPFRQSQYVPPDGLKLVLLLCEFLSAEITGVHHYSG